MATNPAPFAFSTPLRHRTASAVPFPTDAAHAFSTLAPIAASPRSAGSPPPRDPEDT